MQTIGDQLAEARKAKGISLREAAESTKIRGEYLSAFEGNTFDINLPDIYVRGFLRNYSKFLSLDPDKILTDYDDLISGATGSGARADSPEIFGRMDLGERQEQSDAASTALAEGGRRDSEDHAHERRRESTFNYAQGSDKHLYLKVGAVVAGALVVVVLLVMLVMSVIRSDPADRDLAGENTAGIQEFFLVGRGPIDEVRVTEVNTEEVLFEGSISEGDRISLRRNGPVDVRVTQAEYLRIEENGRGGNLGGSGLGRARWGE